MDRRTFAFVFLIASSAAATPRALPFTYPYATLPKDGIEVEQYIDAVPAKVISLNNGNPIYIPQFQLQTEVEWGVTDHVELALYATIVPPAPSSVTPPNQLTEGNGSKQRVRFRLSEQGKLPVDLGFYFELVETTTEFEIEGKVIVEKTFGRLQLGSTLWVEREFYFDGRGEWVLNPTLGLNVEVTPWLRPGFESWLHAEFLDSPPTGVPRAFALGPHVYAGPTCLVNFGRLWWSFGAYLRASDFDRRPNPGDSFGAIWIRTMLGIGF